MESCFNNRGWTKKVVVVGNTIEEALYNIKNATDENQNQLITDDGDTYIDLIRKLDDELSVIA